MRASGFSTGRPLAQVDALGPVDRDKVGGRNQFPRAAVEHIEESVLRCLHQHLAQVAADLEVRQDEVRSGVKVPGVSRCGLVVPDVFAGSGPQRDDRVDVEVVAAAGRAIRLVPGAAVADTDVEQVELRVVGHGVPHGPAATQGPPLTLPGRLGDLERRRCVGARAGRHRVEAPELLAVLAVVGRDVAAYAHLRADVADDHPAVDDARRAGDSIGLRGVYGQLGPDGLTGRAVECDQAPVQRSEEEALSPGRKTPVDDVAAGPHGRVPRHLRIVLPAQLAGERVVGLHF